MRRVHKPKAREFPGLLPNCLLKFEFGILARYPMRALCATISDLKSLRGNPVRVRLPPRALGFRGVPYALATPDCG